MPQNILVVGEIEAGALSPTTLELLNGASALARDWLAANSMFRAMPVRVEEFVLYSSFQGRSGSIYTVEAAFPLERV